MVDGEKERSIGITEPNNHHHHHHNNNNNNKNKEEIAKLSDVGVLVLDVPGADPKMGTCHVFASFPSATLPSARNHRCESETSSFSRFVISNSG